MANLGQLLMQGLQAGIKMKQELNSIEEANRLKEKYRTYGLMAQKVLEAPPEMRADVWRRLYEQLPEDWKMGVSPDYNPDELEAFLAKSAAGYLYLQHRVNQLKMENLEAGTYATRARGYRDLVEAWCAMRQNDPACNAMLSRERFALRYGKATSKPYQWSDQVRKIMRDHWREILSGQDIKNIPLNMTFEQVVRKYPQIGEKLNQAYGLLLQRTREYYNKYGTLPEPMLIWAQVVSEMNKQKKEEETPQLELKGYPSPQSGKVIDENRNPVLLEWKKKQGLIK